MATIIHHSSRRHSLRQATTRSHKEQQPLYHRATIRWRTHTKHKVISHHRSNNPDTHNSNTTSHLLRTNHPTVLLTLLRDNNINNIHSNVSLPNNNSHNSSHIINKCPLHRHRPKFRNNPGVNRTLNSNSNPTVYPAAMSHLPHHQDRLEVAARRSTHPIHKGRMRVDQVGTRRGSSRVLGRIRGLD